MKNKKKVRILTASCFWMFVWFFLGFGLFDETGVDGMGFGFSLWLSSNFVIVFALSIVFTDRWVSGADNED